MSLKPEFRLKLASLDFQLLAGPAERQSINFFELCRLNFFLKNQLSQWQWLLAKQTVTEMNWLVEATEFVRELLQSVHLVNAQQIAEITADAELNILEYHQIGLPRWSERFNDDSDLNVRVQNAGSDEQPKLMYSRSFSWKYGEHEWDGDNEMWKIYYTFIFYRTKKAKLNE